MNLWYKGRRLAPYLYTRRTQQIGKQSITVLWKLTCRLRTCHNIKNNCLLNRPAQSPPCMQNFQVAKGSRAPARVEAENRRTIHAHVVHARPLAPPRPARPGEASARARVVLSFSLPNCFNKMEIAQLFKLASLHLK